MDKKQSQYDRERRQEEKDRIVRDKLEAKYDALRQKLEDEYEGSAFVEYDSHSEGLCLKLWGIESIEKARELLKLYEKLQPFHLCRK